MRYIAIGNLSPGPAWIKAANNAASAVRKAKPEDRSKVINDHSHVWGLFKGALRTLSHGKCWYCEAIDARSDNAVDHYRPKGNVRGATPRHEGYWWLAFEWSNYRFSCTYCNSIRKSAGKTGGKQDYADRPGNHRHGACPNGLDCQRDRPARLVVGSLAVLCQRRRGMGWRQVFSIHSCIQRAIGSERDSNGLDRRWRHRMGVLEQLVGQG